MDVKQPARFKGTSVTFLYKANGEVIVSRKDNLIVDVGFDLIADALCKASGRPDVMSHIAVGAGTVAADHADTALGSELARKAATYAHTAGTKTFTLTATFAAGEGTGAITEAGILNAAVGGIMFDRVVFPVKNKEADDVLVQQFIITMNES